MDIYMRWMIRRDLPAVLEIERASHRHPRTEEMLLAELKRRTCIGYVAEHGERIVGFMSYELGRTRIDDLGFAVHPDWRRKGVGSAMLAKLVGKLSARRRRALWLVVRESALAMCLFLRARGCLASGVLRGHYDDSGEDGFIFQFRVAHEPADPGYTIKRMSL